MQQWSEPTNEAIQGLGRFSFASQELGLQDFSIECVWLLVCIQFYLTKFNTSSFARLLQNVKDEITFLQC